MNLDEMEKLASDAMPQLSTSASVHEMVIPNLLGTHLILVFVTSANTKEEAEKEARVLVAARTFVPEAIARMRKLERVAEAAKEYKKLQDEWAEFGRPVPAHYEAWRELGKALKELEKE